MTFAGAVRVHERALEAPLHQVDLGAWSVVARPEWMELEDVVAVRAATGLIGETVPLLDRGATPALSAALESAPQVSRVVALRRKAPDRLEAVLEVRVPVVGVLLPGETPRYVEVDEDGVVLGPPRDERPVRGGRPLRLVVGAAGASDAAGGLGADVRAAARLSLELDRAAAASGAELVGRVERIDVSNFGGRRSAAAPEVVLRLGAADNAGCAVEWGRIDGGDPPAHAKVAHLLRAEAFAPGLHGLRAVKLAFDDLVLVREPPAPPSEE